MDAFRSPPYPMADLLWRYYHEQQARGRDANAAQWVVGPQRQPPCVVPRTKATRQATSNEEA